MKQELTLKQTIEELITPVLEEQGIELVDVELHGKKGGQILKVFIDTENGVILDQCVKVSRDISDVLDTRDIIMGRYRLEVSSPGLDRPLKTARDFIRNLNRKVKIEYFIDDGDKKKVIEGVIKSVENDIITIENKKQNLDFKIENIYSAKIVPVW